MSLGRTSFGVLRRTAFFLTVAVTAVASFQAPAAADDRSFSSTHFSMTWSDERGIPAPADANGDGIPDSVERVVAAFERARAFVIEDLGYQAPPVDEEYPLYIGTEGNAGYTRFAPGGTGESRPSFTVVPSHLFGSTTSQVAIDEFAAHEYFHAVQNGLHAHADDWIAEATATWVAAVFVGFDPAALDSLRSFVPVPRAPLYATGAGHEYGAFTFFEFLVESLGDRDVVKELWDAMASTDAIPTAPNLGSLEAIEFVLAQRGVDLAFAWARFLEWEWILSRYEHADAYRIALGDVSWPRASNVTTVSGDSCRLSLGDSGAGLLPLSGDYVGLKPSDPQDVATARLVAVGPPGTVGTVMVRSQDRSLVAQPLTFTDQGLASSDVPFGSAVRRITLSFGNPSTGGPAATVAYSLRVEGADATEAPRPYAPAATTFGTRVAAGGTILCGDLPAPFANIRVTETDVVTGAQEIVDTTTDQAGNWRMAVDPETNVTYAVEVVDPLLGPAASSTTRVNVRVHVSADLSSDRVLLGDRVDVSGVVTPAHPDSTVVIEFRRPERAWRLGASTATGPQGKYSAEVTLPATGIWEMRARVESTGDEDHIPGSSGPRLVAVRRD